MDYQSYHNSTTNQTPDLFPDEIIIPGGFWERFGASFLDGIIIGICNFLLQLALGDNVGTSLLSLVIGWLYFALQESGSAQATIGKKALGLKVVNMEGQRISFGQATGRHFGKFISAIILFIGYLMMLWDEKKQTLHDKMANTQVVKG